MILFITSLASKSNTAQSEITKLTADIATVNLKLTNHCKQIETNLSRVSSDNPMDTTSPPTSSALLPNNVERVISSVLNEEKEKSKRKLNFILHNVPESNVENVDTRKQHDKDTAMAIINQHLSVPASISNVVRLGKRQIPTSQGYLGFLLTQIKPKLKSFGTVPRFATLKTQSTCSKSI